MSVNTRLTLIDTVIEALQSDDEMKIAAAQNLLRVKCQHHHISWMKFLFEEVVPIWVGTPFEKLEGEGFRCGYCGRNDFRTEQALKSHLGKKHWEKKHEWGK